MRNLVAGVVLGAVMFTAGAVFTASKSDNDVLREARDRQQIDELMWKYARALDTGNAEAYAALYTPDGQFSAGGTATKGRDALKAMIAEHAGVAADKILDHDLSLYDVQKGTLGGVEDEFIYVARLDAYHITLAAGSGRETPPRVAGVGRSIDEFERVNGKWLIKSRNVAPMD
jgi:hypothetical protein